MRFEELKGLTFVGLGLNDEAGLSLRGLEEIRNADSVFVELYTSLLPEFSLKRFEKLAGKTVTLLSRRDLEEANGKTILEAAKQGYVVFLVPGDPFVATTHVALRLEAEKRGIKTRIVHGASAISAVIGFGKTVTIPFPETLSETPYNVITENQVRGLHTLCLLDLKADEHRFLSVNEGLQALMAVERKIRKGVVTSDSLAVGAARVGSVNPTLKADWIGELLKYDFGGPPQSLIFPGELHFMEIEALIRFAGAPEKLRGVIK